MDIHIWIFIWISIYGVPGIPWVGYLGVGYLGGTDGTLGPMGPWDRWDLGLKDPGPQGPPIIKLHIDYIMKLFIDTWPGPARPDPASLAGPDRNR